MFLVNQWITQHNLEILQAPNLTSWLSSLPVCPLHLKPHCVLKEVHTIPVLPEFILAGSCLAPNGLNGLTYLPCHLSSDPDFLPIQCHVAVLWPLGKDFI